MSGKQPTREEQFLAIAISKLNSKDRRIWNMYSLGRMSHREIAKAVRVSHPAITQKLKTIQKKICKAAKEQMALYNVLKSEDVKLKEEEGEIYVSEMEYHGDNE